MSRSIAAVMLLMGPLLVAAPAVADEAKSALNASMILSIVGAPVQSRASAYDEALKQPPPAAPDGAMGEVLPDGSVRYGRTIVTVKNPCPPGTVHYEPPPLPGRRPR